MRTTIRLLEPVGVPADVVRAVVPTFEPGCYVAAYDPDRGMASLVCTMNETEALHLPSGEALALWRSSPTGDPVRPDGRPNRPLTAFMVELA